ncbi:MAG: hypothetical protein JWM59_214 [Verrucomicrobiales bacterium]|nr:hypothetical protein [Verrucomicrobiales bacterium]
MREAAFTLVFGDTEIGGGNFELVAGPNNSLSISPAAPSQGNPAQRPATVPSMDAVAGVSGLVTYPWKGPGKSGRLMRQVRVLPGISFTVTVRQ